jgi:hypothetical protein
MAIMPKFKPGQLVYLTNGVDRLLGLVKSTSMARRRGEPPLVLVEWCGDVSPYKKVEYIPQNMLTLEQ